MVTVEEEIEYAELFRDASWKLRGRTKHGDFHVANPHQAPMGMDVALVRYYREDQFCHVVTPEDARCGIGAASEKAAGDE